ncbi:C6 zinc finger domain containing [Pyrenophora seminiperda CCB06]|uniref:C6 zinc finger domain containing n=1 Tax=Pyrenophora seminiperda CCB06 TaxID=1302712 RepID=A0A3M7MAV3_9PLEO|nr:C6 zinc finger domain containing [Pyrenophora seminiperda CCB06]
MSVSSRSRLTCSACTRRKVKCSKTVPCTNCIRRDQQDTCGINDAQGNPTSPPQSLTSRAQELDYLRQRLTQLENEIHQDNPTDRVATAHNLHPETPDVHSNETVHDIDSIAATRDAATVLEFLAWGRRKDPDCHTVVSIEPAENVSPGVDTGILQDLSQLPVLQLLLPNAQQVRQLVDYHRDCLLWYHGSYFDPTFQTQLSDFYDTHNGMIEDPAVNLQWVALLFSILTASLTCAPDTQARAWGFDEAERETLSRRWFQAIITCLNRADYTSNLNILSCQAITTATVSAHLLGFSTTQSIHLATAVRVAQSLGIHHLGPDIAGNLVVNETGRRVWCELCNQDWFSIPFSETYLISPRYTTSAPPSNSHDHDLIPVDADIPTITSYSRFLRDIAIIMPQLQDGLISSNTAYTRYEKVLNYDARLRGLATRERPLFMTNAPLDSTWPVWVPWARHALAITSSHKIVMIHRSFLLDSFVNPAFAFTRRTCLAASKTIIKEYNCLVEEDGPTLWIHQAFAVAASITLLLDVLHRDPGERECSEHRTHAQNVVRILKSRRDSMIATRGTKLLEAILAQTAPDVMQQRRGKHNRDGTPAIKFNVSALVRDFCKSNSANLPLAFPQDHASSPSSEDPPPMYHSSDSNLLGTDFTQSHPSFPFPATGANSFDDLLYLANYDFTNT